jgi:uncharacterized protein
MKAALLVFGASAICLACHAAAGVDATAKSASGPDAERAFLTRLDAQQRVAQDALGAANGDGAALDRLQNAANSGDGYAQFRLSFLYKEGKGVRQSNAEYVSWLRKSAEAGYADAQVRLCALYEKGQGVPRDLYQAAEWARRAAEQGNAAGIATLVTDYYAGKGVTRDYVQAIKWQSILVALTDVKDAEGFFEKLKLRGGPDAVAKGQALAQEWLARFQATR